jgi:hypothetical protein
VIVTWNCLQDALHICKKFIGMLSSTSGNAHVSSVFLGFRESVNTEHQPSAALEVSVVVFKYSCKSTIVKFLDGSVGLTHFICSFEVLRNLKSNLFLCGHFVKQVLGLGQHQVTEHVQSLTGEVGAGLRWLQLGYVLLQVFENPSGLLHVATRVLDTISIKRHEAGHSPKADAVVVLGAQRLKDW